ncbi:hypothetical protein USB125703_01983 [Pseudoclavibacter triregionum]|nr:hypothetical protein USB125703_01983 [Pseudoclavibacter triregionum]
MVAGDRPVEELPNIGPALASALRQVGIHREGELTRLGAVAAWERLREAGLYDCASSLQALEGAVQGIRWHELPAERRAALRAHARGSRS